MPNQYGIAIDIGTSGIRAQAINLDDSKVVSTAITLRHPLPGQNVVDHLHFAMEIGRDQAHKLLLEAINKVLNDLEINLKNVTRVAVCGNPIQLSLFHNIEIRDLAFWGVNALERMKVTPPNRNSTIVKPLDVDLHVNEEAEIYIPPAIKHEIGADALAMMVKADIINKEGIFLVTDFGTNAEMALIVDGEIYTCSAAAGPAIEGQMIEKGRLASPGTICDLKVEDNGWKTVILDEDLNSVEGDTVNPNDGKIIKKSDNEIKATGITGTGVLAAFALGLDAGLVKIPKIQSTDHKIHLEQDIYLSEKDILNIGKALGAFRAAHITLAEEAEIFLDEIDATYMTGASGFYVDPIKSIDIGQIPPSSKVIYQIGNTSLAMATDIIINPDLLDELQEIADKIRGKHIMLATSETFEKIYSLELSIYEQGMPDWMYNDWLNKYGFQKLPPKETNPEIHRAFERDIPELGEKGLHITKVGSTLEAQFEGCTNCMTCMRECPEDAITVEEGKIYVRTDRCAGMSCQRCVLSCPEKVFKYGELIKSTEKE